MLPFNSNKKKVGDIHYRKDNHFTLDPTHIHEFGSREEIISTIEKNGFEVKKIHIDKCRYSLFELVLKLLIKTHLLRPTIRTREFFLKTVCLTV